VAEIDLKRLCLAGGFAINKTFWFKGTLMRIAELIQRWMQEGQTRTPVRAYTVHLPLRDAARVEALHVMYPGRSDSQLMADLIRAALDELEVAMPYIPGNRIIAEDDYGDPIYEDLGPTPRFYSLSHEILRKLADMPLGK
jgi:hypothetical protein